MTLPRQNGLLTATARPDSRALRAASPSNQVDRSWLRKAPIERRGPMSAETVPVPVPALTDDQLLFLGEVLPRPLSE